MKKVLGNIGKVMIALIFIASISIPLKSCASGRHGQSVGSSGHIGNPHDKNHHVWGK